MPCLCVISIEHCFIESSLSLPSFTTIIATSIPSPPSSLHHFHLTDISNIIIVSFLPSLNSSHYHHHHYSIFVIIMFISNHQYQEFCHLHHHHLLLHQHCYIMSVITTFITPITIITNIIASYQASHDFHNHRHLHPWTREALSVSLGKATHVRSSLPLFETLHSISVTTCCLPCLCHEPQTRNHLVFLQLLPAWAAGVQFKEPI